MKPPAPRALGGVFLTASDWTSWRLDAATGLVRVVRIGLDGDLRRQAWLNAADMERLLCPRLWDRLVAACRRRTSPGTGYWVPVRRWGAFFLEEAPFCACRRPNCPYYVAGSRDMTAHP